MHHVLYLIFNEGYTTSSGPAIHRADLTAEAVRLTRELRRLRPLDTETSGLLALMLLTEARRAARVDGAGDLVPLAEQERTKWDKALIGEGVALVTEALSHGSVGPYQLQAAIAALHDEAETAEDTDWPQILALYEMLDYVAPNPMATINRAVAVGMVQGPLAGLALLGALATMSESRTTTFSSRSGAICWKWRGTPAVRSVHSAWRRAGRPVCPSGAIWRNGPVGRLSVGSGTD